MGPGVQPEERHVSCICRSQRGTQRSGSLQWEPRERHRDRTAKEDFAVPAFLLAPPSHCSGGGERKLQEETEKPTHPHRWWPLNLKGHTLCEESGLNFSKGWNVTLDWSFLLLKLECSYY